MRALFRFADRCVDRAIAFLASLRGNRPVRRCKSCGRACCVCDPFSRVPLWVAALVFALTLVAMGAR